MSSSSDPRGGKRRCLAPDDLTLPYAIEGLYENTSTLHSAVLHARYKRFLGDVAFLGQEAKSGPSAKSQDLTTVHVPNTGPMTGLLDDLPVPVYLSKSSNKSRKYAHTLEWMRVDDTWVGVHSAKANAMVAKLLDAGVLDASLPKYSSYKKEVKLGGSTRIDFELTDEETGRRCLIEVKSVTMRQAEGSVAVFPDTKSERAQKHVRELVDQSAREGVECMMVYVVQRGDCDAFLPCLEKDPAYYQLVKDAVQEEKLGVLVLEIDLLEVAGGHCVMFNRLLPLAEWQ